MARVGAEGYDRSLSGMGMRTGDTTPMDPLDRAGAPPFDPRSSRACDPPKDPRGHFLNALRGSFGSDHLADRPAMIFSEGAARLSFGELDALACRAAAWLQSLGVAPGDRVALLTQEKRSFLVAHLGVL